MQSWKAGIPRPAGGTTPAQAFEQNEAAIVRQNQEALAALNKMMPLGV